MPASLSRRAAGALLFCATASPLSLVPTVTVAQSKPAIVDLRAADNLVGFYDIQIWEFLAKNLEFTPSQKVAGVRFHFLRLENGKAVAKHRSSQFKKALFPGEMFFPGDMGLPKPAFFEGFRVKTIDVGKPVSGGVYHVWSNLSRSIGGGSGVMITVSWDDMSPEDPVRGLMIIGG